MRKKERKKDRTIKNYNENCIRKRKVDLKRKISFQKKELTGKILTPPPKKTRKVVIYFSTYSTPPKKKTGHTVRIDLPNCSLFFHRLTVHQAFYQT